MIHVAFAMFAVLIVLIPLAIFSIPLLLIWTNHRRKMEELKLRKLDASRDVQARLAVLQDELKALRDTSTQYDLSFDSALQQMDQRMSHMERQLRAQQAQAPEQTVTRH